MPREATTPVPEVDQLLAFAALVDTIRTSPGRATKQAVLKAALQRTPYLKRFIASIYDPFRQYRFNTLSTCFERAEPGVGMWDILDGAAGGLMGPHLAASRWRSFVDKVKPPLRMSCQILLDKDADLLGLSPKHVNSVLEELGYKTYPTFEVQRAVEWDRKPGTFWASEELVGQRVLAFLSEDRDPILFTPEGKPLWCLEELRDPLFNWVGEDAVLDGKIAALDGTGFFEAEQSIKRNSLAPLTNTVFWVFDLLSQQEWRDGRGEIRYTQRRQWLRGAISHIASEWVRPVPQHLVESRSKYREVLQRGIDKEWLGIILRRDAPYESGYTRNLQVVNL